MKKFSEDSIIFQRRKGTSDSPYIDINEPLAVNDKGGVSLREIPSEYYGVTVTGEGRDWQESRSSELDSNSYKVDYLIGSVTFDQSNSGRQLSFAYKGTGQTFSPASRIYTNAEGGAVEKTLQDLADSAQVVDDALEEILTELPQNQEIKDIKKGADGTVYPTPKERLDSEYNKLRAKDTELESDLDEFKDQTNVQLADTKTQLRFEINRSENEVKNLIDNRIDNLDGLKIKGGFDLLHDLENEYPNGTDGLYAVGNTAYGWNEAEKVWKSLFSLKPFPWSDFMYENGEVI